MRTFSAKQKVAAALGAGAIAVAGGGIAYAYWTATSTGSGSGSTAAGADSLSYTQSTLTDMYPGDSSQPLVVTVKNTSDTQKEYVADVKAYITTSNASCTGADFLLNGSAAPSTSDTAVNLNWTAGELAVHGTQDSTNTIQFNDTADNQDACKDATVTVNYVTS